jgi:microcin C transport system ATP-binding protein
MMTPTLATSCAALPPEGALAPKGGLSALGSLLDVKDLTVSFNGKPVVHSINFSIKAGERIALVGESGSGKTVTALSLLRYLLLRRA